MTSAALTLPVEAILNTFIDMVRIDSPSGHEEPMRFYLEERFKAMGLTGRVDAAGNLIYDLPAQQATHNHLFILSGHMDVVPPCIGVKPVVEGSGMDRVVRSDNTTVLGADDKSALAVIVEVLAHRLKENLPIPHTRLVFTTREEVGLEGAKELDEKELAGGKFSLIFDHTGEQGIIINEAPTLSHYTIQCHGVSTHAGIQPEKGVNAIIYAGRVLAQMKTGRLDPDSTANIGKIRGGKGTNVVPDWVEITGEVRSHNPARVQEELETIRQLLEKEKANYPGTSYTFTTKEEFAAYRMDPNTPGVQLIYKAVEQAGLRPHLFRTNGGSDNNIFIQKGVPGVVMSAGYVDPHSLHEQVSLQDMAHCAHILSNALELFATHEF